MPAPRSGLARLLPHNPLFRILVINGVAGAGLGLLFVAGLLALDVAGIRSLLDRTGEWAIGLALLSMGSVTTFASVAMGGAIMLMPKDETPPPDEPRGGQPVLVAVPVRSARRRD